MIGFSKLEKNHNDDHNLGNIFHGKYQHVSRYHMFSLVLGRVIHFNIILAKTKDLSEVSSVRTLLLPLDAKHTSQEVTGVSLPKDKTCDLPHTETEIYIFSN